MQTERSPRATVLIRASLRVLWLLVVPATLAALVLVYLVPVSSGAEAHGFVDGLANLAERNPLFLGVGLFLLFGWLLHHWSVDLPGGRHLTPLPFRIASATTRECLRTEPGAAELLATLLEPSARRRVDSRLSLSGVTVLEMRLGNLVSAFESGDLDQVRSSETSLREVAAPALSAKFRRKMFVQTGSVAAAALAALLLRSRVVETYRVLSESMLPTLSPGDCIAASKLAYDVRIPFRESPIHVRSPRRGDVVVFANPMGNDPPRLVKRVVGLPGDRITMRGAHPVINGWEIPSCDAGTYVYATANGAVRGRLVVEFLNDETYLTVLTPVTQAFDHYDVRQGEVFVLGDNRNNSSDSRAWNGGHGGGLGIGTIDGETKWFILGAHRDGTADLSRFLNGFGPVLHLEGIDTRPLEHGIAECRRRRPASTTPPDATAVASGSGSSAAG